MKTPPLVYVAGPFSAANRSGVELNIESAEKVGLDVAAGGGMPVIPHCNTRHPDFERRQTYEFWIEGTMRLLVRSDALVLAPGWDNSLGAVAEYQQAVDMKMPIFMYDSLINLSHWIREEWHK